jgi:hypothetical protein
LKMSLMQWAFHELPFTTISMQFIVELRDR